MRERERERELEGGRGAPSFGGGVQGGRVVGASDPIGGIPAERPTQPGEVVATIFRGLGLDPTGHLPGPAGRPFPLVDIGNGPIEELFA